jgi:hypothetical protein
MATFCLAMLSHILLHDILLHLEECMATFWWPHSVCVLLQAPRADLDDQRDLAAAQYQSLSSTMLDWQIFFDWRLGEPD